MRRNAGPALALIIIGAPAASAHPTAEARFALTQAQICFAARDLTATPRPECRDIEFPEAAARVVTVDAATHEVVLRHVAVPGINAAGSHRYHIDPAYLVEALAAGDQAQVTFESRRGHIVDIFPLLQEKRRR